MTNKKEVVVLFGTGSIGLAIIRRVSAGKHIILADYSLKNASTTGNSTISKRNWQIGMAPSPPPPGVRCAWPT